MFDLDELARLEAGLTELAENTPSGDEDDDE